MYTIDGYHIGGSVCTGVRSVYIQHSYETDVVCVLMVMVPNMPVC